MKKELNKFFGIWCLGMVVVGLLCWPFYFPVHAEPSFIDNNSILSNMGVMCPKDTKVVWKVDPVTTSIQLCDGIVKLAPLVIGYTDHHLIANGNYFYAGDKLVSPAFMGSVVCFNKPFCTLTKEQAAQLTENNLNLSQADVLKAQVLAIRGMTQTLKGKR